MGVVVDAEARVDGEGKVKHQRSKHGRQTTTFGDRGRSEIGDVPWGAAKNQKVIVGHGQCPSQFGRTCPKPWGVAGHQRENANVSISFEVVTLS